MGNLAENLKKALLAKGLKGEARVAFIEALGIEYSWVDAILYGKSVDPSARRLLKLATALGIDPYELIGVKEHVKDEKDHATEALSIISALSSGTVSTEKMDVVRMILNTDLSVAHQKVITTIGAMPTTEVETLSVAISSFREKIQRSAISNHQKVKIEK